MTRQTENKEPAEETCRFSIPWYGECKNKVPCKDHKDLVCRVCGKPATQACGSASVFVCGIPLCDECRCPRSH